MGTPNIYTIEKEVSCLEVELSGGIALIPLRTTTLLEEILKTGKAAGLDKPTKIRVRVEVEFPDAASKPEGQ